MRPEADLFFRMISDSTRLRALMLLQREGELCVCELTHALGMSQPKISRHLARLRESGILLGQRTGQWIYYRINPELPAWELAVLKHTLTGVVDSLPYTSDHHKLEAMPNRPVARICA